jgi:hypothetical protein
MSSPNKNTHFVMRNINGTSKKRYANSGSKTGESWLKIWRSQTGSNRSTCCVHNCSRTDLVGGHVMKCDGRSSNEWWLAPICNSHNNHTNKDEMFIDMRITLISVREDQ